MSATFYGSFRSSLLRRFVNPTPLDGKTELMLGCTFETFRAYILKRLRPGMTLENLGSVWTVSYILSEKEIGRGCRERVYYKNFYPLFKRNPELTKSTAIVPARIHKKRLTRAKLCQKLGILARDIRVAKVVG